LCCIINQKARFRPKRWLNNEFNHLNIAVENLPIDIKLRDCNNWFGRNYAEFASSPDYCSVPVYDRGHDNCCRECCRRLLAIRSQFFSRIGWVNYEFEMRGRIQTGHPATLLNVSK